MSLLDFFSKRETKRPLIVTHNREFENRNREIWVGKPIEENGVEDSEGFRLIKRWEVQAIEDNNTTYHFVFYVSKNNNLGFYQIVTFCKEEPKLYIKTMTKDTKEIHDTAKYINSLIKPTLKQCFAFINILREDEEEMRQLENDNN